MKSREPSSVGEQIARVRKGLKMKQVTFSEALGLIRPETVSEWENDRRAPGRESLEKIAELAGATYAQLFERFERDGDAAPPYNEAREEMELARIGAMNDSLLRTLERESIAAVIRAQGMRDACRAARIEAEKAPARTVPTTGPTYSEEDVARIVRRTMAEIPLRARTRSKGAGKSPRRAGGAG
jgi:transcriptional regulator with XRE-family HTH domain